MQITRSSLQTAKGPSDWFTGDVYIDTVAVAAGPSRLGAALVHFTPGARTAWHAHTIAQTLHVTEGRGLVQARAEPIIPIRPGDVVHVSGGEWHWHGAAPDHFMTHLSLTEGDTEWGDHVTDAEYGESPT
jgi:quercetin dioxygenase-like cupin family protein